MNQFAKFKGFTLIELIVVIGIIAILAAIVIIAVNPNRQFAQARNTQRNSDVTSLLNALYQYAADTNGSLPAAVTTTESEVCNNSANGAANCTGLADLETALSPTYLSAIPKDPQRTASDNGTNYFVLKGNAGGANGVPQDRVRVRAAGAELGTTIQVTR